MLPAWLVIPGIICWVLGLFVGLMNYDAPIFWEDKPKWRARMALFVIFFGWLNVLWIPIAGVIMLGYFVVKLVREAW